MRRAISAGLGCGVALGAFAEEVAPSRLFRTGFESFLPYDIGNVRGLDASRILGTYRWNGLPVLGQSREATAATQRFDVLAGLAALEAGEVIPGGVVERVDKTVEPRAGRAAAELAGAWYSRTFRSLSADASWGAPALGLRLNALDERGALALEPLRSRNSYLGAVGTFAPRPDLALTASLERQSYRERGEQAALYLDGRDAPPAPRAGTLLGQPWDGSRGRDAVESLRFRWQWREGWALSGGVLRMDERHREADFQGVLQEGGRFDALYLFDGGLRNRARTAHLQADGSFQALGALHRLRFGASRLVNRSFAAGTAVVNLGESRLDAPVTFDPVPAPEQGAAYEAERLRDDGWFVSDSVRLSERWTVLASLRAGRFRQTGANVEAPLDEAYSLTSFGVRFAPSPRLKLYASRGEALERGGTAPISATNALQVLPGFESSQVEAGARFALSRTLSIEAAAFEARRRYEYEDAAREFRQDGTVHHRGLELRAVGAVGGLGLYGSALLLDPRVRGASDAAVDGRRALNVPPRRVTLLAEARLPWEGWSANARLDALSRRPANAANTTYIPGYGLVGAGLEYASPSSPGASLRFEVENLANRGYWSDASGSYLYLGEPRTFSVRLTVPL